ncbi:hypothetical protein F3Y22_tig00110788pilonHSYRG00457 [Hibiscus syriacus]|uniref:Uncharacterized protein n=1 Tax=Hibiscus syriacus TaxID=106335 RepID=A0A6A2ZQ13_HIBSY|nr:hypothetical protein F3Y22_tig00110788pilonHSYRG00457 [Hibiscus syriacus]
MVSEDFSFPKITNPLPQFTSLPSLWRVSSLIYPEYEEEGPASLQRKSLSISSSSESEANKRDPEKMDMLWEEFNEELKCARSLRSRKEAEAQAMLKMAKIGNCRQLICHKKQSKSLLTVIKSLKIKMFYTRNLAWIKN